MFVVIPQVTTVLLQYEVVATSPSDQLRRYILNGYNKDVHPYNDVTLIYGLVYIDCPILDNAAGTIISRIHETQVRSLSFASWLTQISSCFCSTLIHCVQNKRHSF